MTSPKPITLDEQIDVCLQLSRQEKRLTIGERYVLDAAVRTLRELQQGKWVRVDELKEHNFHGFD